MQIAPYLNFNGQCEEAFKFYEQCFGGKITAMLTYEGSPAAEQVPPDWGKKILHTHLIVGDRELMGSDAPPKMFEESKGVYISLQFNDLTEAERIFNALAENGTVQMPFEETFWAERFAMLVDRFGTLWMINCDRAA